LFLVEGLDAVNFPAQFFGQCGTGIPDLAIACFSPDIVEQSREVSK
jgi:hypothetical protein